MASSSSSENSKSVLVLSRYLPESISLNEATGEPQLGDVLEQQHDNMDTFNHPRIRRVKTLHYLATNKGHAADTFTFKVPSSDDKIDNKLLELYKAVASPGLLEFLSTAWHSWDALGQQGQDPASSLPITGNNEHENSTKYKSPPLVPGNTPLSRDPHERPSKNVMGRVGYYCTDTCTPIFSSMLQELCWDAAVIQQAVQQSNQYAAVYALATHPGHHAAYDSFGGYCYVNHAALAARLLQQKGHEKVAVLDVDYHCGNGSASIFYNDPSVLVISIHCHPDHEYPFHSGFEDQIGIDDGVGATMHIPLLPGTTWKEYSIALEKAMTKIKDFGATSMIVSLGLDTLDGDPCAIRRSGFKLSGNDYVEMGRMIGSIRTNNQFLTTIFVQEGGYKMEDVPTAVANVLAGFRSQRIM